MVLVDTSVWIDHFRKGQSMLAELLVEGAVLTHPFIVGELACGNLKQREKILSSLDALPSAQPALDREVSRMVEARRLYGRGIGWVDAHILAAALLTNCRLWTLDSRLAEVARDIGVINYAGLVS